MMYGACPKFMRYAPCTPSVPGTASSPEPGTALRTILAAADLLRAKACVVISPDSTTIEPNWLQRLVRPVYNDNFDLVSPIYRGRSSKASSCEICFTR